MITVPIMPELNTQFGVSQNDNGDFNHTSQISMKTVALSPIRPTQFRIDTSVTNGRRLLVVNPFEHNVDLLRAKDMNY